jgi:hypothetical protein
MFVVCEGGEGVQGGVRDNGRQVRSAIANAVHARFDLASPTASPFPADRFTVADVNQSTGRRVNLPLPDCVVRASDCQDVALLNELDGFNMRPLLSIPFDGPIDPGTVTSHSLFVVAMGNTDPHEERLEHDHEADDVWTPSDTTVGAVTGVNQVVWDPATLTLYARVDRPLDEHARYALVVTNRILDPAGRPIARSEEFASYRETLASQDLESQWYRRSLLTAEWAARTIGTRERDIIAVSSFTTQSATYLLDKIAAQIHAGAPPIADFNVGPAGSRAVYDFSQVQSIIFNQQRTTGPALTNVEFPINIPRFIPGTVGRIAFGRFSGPDYLVHPGQYIPRSPSRTGSPQVQGTVTQHFTLWLPAGPTPAGGWPVIIVGHQAGSHRMADTGLRAAFSTSRGYAVIGIDAVGHGWGPLTQYTLNMTNGTQAIVPAPGRAVDSDGNGLFTPSEGEEALAPNRLRMNTDSLIQNAAALVALQRTVQGGVDVDGDGQVDLDPSLIYYWGQSRGSYYGATFVGATSGLRAASLHVGFSPLIETRRLSFPFRPTLGAALAARTPSLINPNGLTSIGGVAVAAPFFNENIPLRNQAPVVNNISGAMALQTFFDRLEWANTASSPSAFARRIHDRPVMLLFAKGDITAPNPSNAEFARAGDLYNRTIVYRHDLFFATHPTAIKDPHIVPGRIADPVVGEVARGIQENTLQFFESDGVTITAPFPSQYFEYPMLSGSLEDLAFIP